MWNELLNRFAALFKACILAGLLAISPTIIARPQKPAPKQVSAAEKKTGTDSRQDQTFKRDTGDDSAKKKLVDRLTEKSPDKPESNPASEKEKERDFAIESRMTLGDGRSLRGLVRFKGTETLVLTHESEGIQYEKRIGMMEIAHIEITKWKGKFIKENRSGMVYEFNPEEYKIRLRDGTELRRSGDFFPFFRQFRAENRNGNVTLFSYWVDLKKPDGTWHTGIGGPDTGLRVVSHPDTVRKIEFEK
ncbi:MAG: hypothetical protein JNM27_21875 [Leptospirales bacterium]|nr:hypothetical protein [Leptospirales bacterium]